MTLTATSTLHPLSLRMNETSPDAPCCPVCYFLGMVSFSRPCILGNIHVGQLMNEITYSTRDQPARQTIQSFHHCLLVLPNPTPKTHPLAAHQRADGLLHGRPWCEALGEVPPVSLPLLLPLLESGTGTAGRCCCREAERTCCSEPEMMPQETSPSCEC